MVITLPSLITQLNEARERYLQLLSQLSASSNSSSNENLNAIKIQTINFALVKNFNIIAKPVERDGTIYYYDLEYVNPFAKISQVQRNQWGNQYWTGGYATASQENFKEKTKTLQWGYSHAIQTGIVLFGDDSISKSPVQDERTQNGLVVTRQTFVPVFLIV